MTRLADLNPRWLRAVADPLSQGYGVEFDAADPETARRPKAEAGEEVPT